MTGPDHTALARTMKVLAADVRVRIVQLLKGRSLCVNALAARLDVTQGAVSQHLRIMRDAGLVIDERRGHYVHYRLNESVLARWQKDVCALLQPSPDGARSSQATAGRKARRVATLRPEEHHAHVRRQGGQALP
jgi:DNA-binding transcriptional ArsR family regulator